MKRRSISGRHFHHANVVAYFESGYRARFLILTLVSLLMATQAGCVFHRVDPYIVSSANTRELARLEVTEVAVGEFTENIDLLSRIKTCGMDDFFRLQDFLPPAGESYASYFQKALIAELKAAGLYAAESRISLSGSLGLEFWRRKPADNTRYIKWSLVMNSTNGESLEINFVSDFSIPHNIYNVAANCEALTRNIMPGFQALIHFLIAREDFRRLLVWNPRPDSQTIQD